MKPSANNVGDTTPKSSLNKSMKKSLKSRSKVSKSSALSLVQASTSQETPTTSNTLDSVKDKANHRNYAGFGAKSMKIIWEQHDTSDIEVSSDVYPKLAEDVTYKMWELINNIKTYGWHSGGKVTVDLVNEVLKDSDVPPILGAGDSEWDKIESDGTFFFNSDKIVLLRDQYLNEVQSKNIVGPEILSSWVIDRKYSKNLIEFNSHLCNALFLGDEECYRFALDTAAFSPQIGCCLKLLLKKLIDILAFEQKFETLDRCLTFLRALSFNPHSRDVECREQLFHLSEILTCILLGPYVKCNNVAVPIVQETDDVHIKQENCESDMIKKEEIDPQEEFQNTDFSPYKTETEMCDFKYVDIGSLGRQCTNVIVPIIQDTVDAHIKHENIESDMIKEEETDPQEEFCNSEFSPYKTEMCDFKYVDTVSHTTGCLESQCTNVVVPIVQDTVDVHLKQENIESDMIKEETDQQEDFSPYKAEMCDFKYVDTVCHTIGCVGSQFGYLQNECTFLIQRRIENFFDSRKYTKDPFALADLEFISRCVRGLISLGEYAFREIIPFLYKINSSVMLEWIWNDFAPGAIFLRGRDDIFLYEWLEDLCGAKLQPFMVYSYGYHQKLTTKRYKCLKTPTFNISPKIVLKILDKQFSKPVEWKDIFPDGIKMREPFRKIGFKFAGCRPVVVKPKFKTEANCFRPELLSSFNSHTVVGKRKLLKTLSDKKKVVELSNYCFLQI